jgi:hypothetical protein
MNKTNDLPTELLMQIVTYLGPNEKSIGLLICRDWYEVFRYSLYSTIDIRDLCQLKLFFESLLVASFKNTMPNGYLIKHLFIQKRKSICSQKLKQEQVIIPRQFFEKLPDLCPHLEKLDFDPETWKFVCFNTNILKWKRIQQLPTLANLGATLPFLHCLGGDLTALSIQSSMIVNISTQARLVSILSLSPNVEEFSIIGDEDNARPMLNLTIDDIEAIHELLPRLKSLNITGDNIQMIISDSDEVLQHISLLPTVSNLESLNWNTRLIPTTWLFYVAHKYPSLRHLTIDVQHDREPTLSATRDYMQFEKALLLNLVEKCPYLLTIALSCPILEHWLNPSFFETLNKNQCIQSVMPLIEKSNQIQGDTEFRLARQYGHHLLTALEIEQWRFDDKLPATLQYLASFTQLNYLEIKCDSYHDEYNMELVLDSCPILETFVVEWGTFSVQTMESKMKHHPLKTLNATFVAFTPQLFQYLSQRCQSLTNLFLAKCKQLCQINDMASQTVVEISMPSNTFHCIVIDGVRLDYSSASMFHHGLSSYVRIASIKTMIPQDDQWYHHTSYQANARKFPLMQKLDEYETTVAKCYFVRREKCAFVNSNKHFLRRIAELKVNNALKTGLMFGYVKIHCKALENFVVDGNFPCPP